MSNLFEMTPMPPINPEWNDATYSISWMSDRIDDISLEPPGTANPFDFAAAGVAGQREFGMKPVETKPKTSVFDNVPF